jgi:hypothetical protein
MVTIEKGKSSDEVYIPIESLKEFINTYVAHAKRKDIIERLEKRQNQNAAVKAQWFINIVLNADAIKSSDMDKLRAFLVENECDYGIQESPFGWGGSVMVILFNMKKVVNIKQVKPTDKIAQYELPNTFIN